jgi:hypothetical protein
MTLRDRDKKALIGLGAALALILVLRFWLDRQGDAGAPRAFSSIPQAEKRLARIRQLTTAATAREGALKRATAEVAAREKGVLQAATAPQAQAQLLQIIRRVAKLQTPPLEIRGVELGQVRPISEDYGETSVAVTLECRIEQLVNLLADFTAQPEILATSEMRLTAGDQKQKTMQARVTVCGLVPRALVPEKKGTAF